MDDLDSDIEDEDENENKPVDMMQKYLDSLNPGLFDSFPSLRLLRSSVCTREALCLRFVSSPLPRG
jgi:hypothetical protein